MTTQAEKILEYYKRPISKRLHKYLKYPSFPKIFDIPEDKQSEILFHNELIADYPNRMGKYLRPTLLLLTHQALTGNIKKATNTAVAMQLSEEWLLIHDDLEDNSDQRRGKPSLHKLYNQALATNAGDSLQIIMWKVLMDNHMILGPSLTFKILEEFYVMLTRTVIGQTTEINLFSKKLQIYSDEDWFFIADGKTSYYTIAGPIRLGAMIAGVTNKQLEDLTLFGLYLGRCFQIVDDVLDLTGTFKGLKKRIGNDIIEGKRTIILSHLLKNMTDSDSNKLKKIYDYLNHDKKDNDIKWVLDKMNELGSIDYAKSLALKYKTKALNMFKNELKFLSNQKARKELETLITFILERDH